MMLSLKHQRCQLEKPGLCREQTAGKPRHQHSIPASFQSRCQRTESADTVKTVGLVIVKAGVICPGKRQNKPIGKRQIAERGSLLNRIKARRLSEIGADVTAVESRDFGIGC